MIAAACLLLFAATRVDLVDDVYQVPANEWRYVDVALRQRTAVVEAAYQAERQPADVRVALLRREDLERLRNEKPHGVLAATDPGASGRLRHPISQPGEYAIVVDNTGDAPAAVHLRVWLDFGEQRGPAVTHLSPRRQLVVILISFAVFFGIVTWSARRLLRTMR
ncbi:MAG: hypothetical protein LAQ30_06635 [Acidobacteriia bacterium]|nr:hypothetical protein [Terriglobia bacterium]